MAACRADQSGGCVVPGSGPSGKQLDFRHSARATHAAVDELGRLLQNVVQAVPQVGTHLGIVPSFLMLILILLLIRILPQPLACLRHYG